MTRKVTESDLSQIWWESVNGPEQYDFAAIFGNDHPVELDLGCGKGLFLFNQSQARPDVNFVGVDWSRTFSRLGADRIARHEITNVRVIAGNAWELLPRFPEGGLHGLHIYFPDPWWKRRHRKRRLVQPSLMPHLSRILAAGGSLSIATDVEEYFGVMLETVATCPDFVRESDPQVSAGADDLDFLTHFERKYRRAGKPVFRARYRRR